MTPLTRARQTRSVRKTVQLSNALMMALEQRAIAEALPVATVVRRAIVAFVGMSRAGALPEVNLDGLEDHSRRGQRGPAAQWPRSVSYVLDSELSIEMEAIAATRQEDLSKTARAAVGLALVSSTLPARPLTRLSNGFVSKSAPTEAETERGQVIDVWRSLNRL